MPIDIKVIDPATSPWEWVSYATPIDPELPPSPTFELGVTKPIGTYAGGAGGNVGTGVLRAAPTEHIYGNVTLSNAAPSIKDKIIHGSVVVPAGVTVPWLVENNYVRGADTGTITHLVNAQSAGVAGTVQYNRIGIEDPARGNNGVDGVRSRNYTAYRNEVFGVVDGFGSFHTGTGHNATYIWGNHVHSLWYGVDLGHGDGITHTDCVQVQGGDQWEVIGNNLDAHTVDGEGTNPSGLGNCCVQLNVGSAPRNLLTGKILKNWLNGGAYQINGIGVSTLNGNVEIRDNRFGRDGLNSGTSPFVGNATATIVLRNATGNQWPGVTSGTSLSVVNTTNRYEDNGALITVRFQT